MQFPEKKIISQKFFFIMKNKKYRFYSHFDLSINTFAKVAQGI